jgi:hypothetical protein
MRSTLFISISFIFILSSAGCIDRDKKKEGRNTLSFPVLTQSDIREIKLHPPKMNDLYRQFRKWAEESHHVFLSELSDAELFALYSAFVAYSMAPYGNSTKSEFQDLLNEDKLDCDNYAFLAYYLFLNGTDAQRGGVEFRFVGWDGGAIGNHAQIFTVSRKRSMLLDPTIGIAAVTDFDSVASGKPVPRAQLIDFSTRHELENYRRKIINALVHGRYKPSDLLYYFAEFEDFRNPSTGSDGWPTPGAYSLKKRNQ